MPGPFAMLRPGPAALGGACAGAAAVLAALWLRAAPPEPPPPDTPVDERVAIRARCGLAAGDRLDAGALRIRCGLDEAQIAALVETALADLGLAALVEQARRGEPPDAARLAEVADRTGSELEAVRVVVLRLAASAMPQRVRLEVERAESTPGAAPPIQLAQLPEPPLAAPRRLVELSADCAAVAGTELRAVEVHIECLRDEDVRRLVGTLLAEAKVGDLVDELRRAALTRPEAARRLSEATGLPPGAIEPLLDGLDPQDPKAANRLEAGLAGQLGLAAGLLRVHAALDTLQHRRDAIADALAGGDTPRAVRQIEAVAADLEAALDQMDPERDVEGLVSAAARIREANAHLAAGQRPQAAASLEAASRALGEAQSLARAGLLLRIADLSAPPPNDLRNAAALPPAAALYQRAAEAVAPAWVEAAAQHAGLLTRIGVRGGDPAPLRQAADTLDLALRVLDPAVVPERWLAAQEQLGLALLRLGDVTPGAESYDRAAAAYQTALDRTDRRTAAGAWTVLKVNHASALSAAARRSGDPERSRAALRAFDELLTEVTRAANPRLWGTLQHNRALVLSALARGEQDADVVSQAIAGFEQALSVVTPETDFERWARAQSALSSELLRLGTWRRDRAAFQRAASVSQAILQRVGRGAYPMAWAAAQSSLGEAKLRLWFISGNAADAAAALRAYEAARDTYARDRQPVIWARSTRDLGSALAMVSGAGTEPARGDRAIALLREALAAVEPRGDPHEVAETRYDLAVVLATVAERRRDRALSAEAATLLREAGSAFGGLGRDSDRRNAEAMLERLSASLGSGGTR